MVVTYSLPYGERTLLPIQGVGEVSLECGGHTVSIECLEGGVACFDEAVWAVLGEQCIGHGAVLRVGAVEYAVNILPPTW